MTSAGAVPIAASRASGRLSYSAPATTPNAGKRRTGTMADNRKYYYLKLKENFFDSDSIVLLEDMKDGILYSNILLKLYLKSLKNGGKLQLDEHIPYTAQMIATLTRHQIGTVERALEIFRQLGLVEQLDSGAFYMTDIELMIGQSSTEAERKRAARLENKALLPPRTKGGHLSDIRPSAGRNDYKCQYRCKPFSPYRNFREWSLSYAVCY